jgi:hypothetical protein
MTRQFTAADDAQRMLLRSVLRDALYWDYRITDACAACRAIDDICASHWDDHDALRNDHATLINHLDSYEGSDNACPLTVRQQQVIVAAVPVAIDYRQKFSGVEDTALLAAYRSLHGAVVSMS